MPRTLPEANQDLSQLASLRDQLDNDNELLAASYESEARIEELNIQTLNSTYMSIITEIDASPTKSATETQKNNMRVLQNEAGIHQKNVEKKRINASRLRSLDHAKERSSGDSL